MLIIITGASKGIGFELVKEFSKDPANLVVAVTRNSGSLLKYVNQHNTSNILPLSADISTSSHLVKIEKLIKSLGVPIDVLINNAAALLKKPFEKIAEKELRNIYQTNVFAPFLLTQKLLPLMNKKKPAHVLNISSMGGFQGSSKFAGLSAYSSSKGALSVLTECLAEELAAKKVKVNCLALGAVQTEMLSRAFPGYQAPLSPESMAGFICYFALNGHRYFNGKILPVSLSTP